MRADIPQEIPARTGKAAHGVGLALGWSAALRTRHVDPILDIGKRRLTRTAGDVILDIRQNHRKLIFRNQNFSALLTVDYRNRRAPISLAGDQPVSQFIVDGMLAAAGLLEPLGHFLLGYRTGCAGKSGGVDHIAVFGVEEHIVIPGLAIEYLHQGSSTLEGRRAHSYHPQDSYAGFLRIER